MFYKPELTIIHSTVPVGTSRRLNAVHSPIHGRHPNLERGILTFRKFVGAAPELDLEKAYRFLRKAKIKTERVSSPEASELSKIMCTTYLGVVAAYMKATMAICDELDVPFREVYGWGFLYNEGYAELGEHRFIRPVLEKEAGGIGGHCVIQNAILLRELLTNVPEVMRLTDFVLGAGYRSKGPLHQDRTWLYCEFWGKKKSLEEIAQDCGKLPEEIEITLKNFNIPLQPYAK